MKRKGKPSRLAETFLGTGSRRGLRRVFLGGDGGARQAGPGGPSSVGIVRWSDLPPPPFFFFRWCCVTSCLRKRTVLVRHTLLRAVSKPIYGRKMRPVVFCAVPVRASGRDRGEPRAVPA